jgi:hypothetical protein
MAFLYAFFLHACSPQPQDNTALFLCQPDIEAHAKPHPFALLIEHVTAFVGSDPDTMRLDEALRQPNHAHCIAAMNKELLDHVQSKHWKVVPSKSVPKHKMPISMVWLMKRKRNPIGEITK